MEAPRTLLFFLTFSALPVSVFLPRFAKDKIEGGGASCGAAVMI
jgi:hypothetical protein